MPARRQRRGQNDAAISISLNGYKPKPITEWSGPVATSPSERFLFDVTNKTNIKYDGTTENISKSLLELPLGKALTADDLSKIPSQWTIDSQAYTINSWATVSTGFDSRTGDRARRIKLTGIMAKDMSLLCIRPDVMADHDQICTKRRRENPSRYKLNWGNQTQWL